MPDRKQRDERDLEIAIAAPGRALAAVFEHSPDCIKILDPQGCLTFMNFNGRCAMEIDDNANISGKPWTDLWPPDAQPSVAEAIARALAGEHARFSGFCPTVKGSPRWWDVGVSPIAGGDGLITALIAVSRDITATVLDRQALESLALEMRHRLRNAYAVSGAIAKISAKHNPQLAEFANDLASRYSALSVVQGKIIDTAGEYSLRELAADILDVYRTAETGLDLDGLDDIILADQQLKALSILFGELGTNSLKYGAILHGGTISLTSRIENDCLHIAWKERFAARDDVKTPAAESGGTGTQLIERLLESMGGSVARDLGDGTLAVSVKLPIMRKGE